MELAQAPHHDAAQNTAQDNILAAFLEPGPLPEIAKRVNMSLAALATWAAKHAELLDAVHKLLLARCKLIAAQLELSALSSLAAVSTTSTHTDDAKLRERSLERQRKAASAILRHRPGGTGFPAFASTSPRGVSLPTAASSSPRPASLQHATRTCAPSAFDVTSGPPTSSDSTSPSLAERFAARTLATLSTA